VSFSTALDVGGMKTRMALLLAAFSALLFAAPAIPPDLPIYVLQFRDLILVAIVLSYIFASGKIADFLQASGRPISKKEVLAAPFAYMLFAALGVLLYFSSGLWAPPQDTIIALGVYLVLAPLGITIGLGAIVLHSFFHDRLNAVQSLDLSMRVILAPIFDGLRGYWTALGAAALLVFISGISYWSSGGQFSLVTMDFLLLSSVVALYYLYKALTSAGNESKASNFVTMLILLTPAILRLFFKELVCAGLSRIPFGLFASCPLEQVGNEVTLALSVLATLVILVPIIPVAYAVIVNALRVATAIAILIKNEAKGKE